MKACGGFLHSSTVSESNSLMTLGPGLLFELNQGPLALNILTLPWDL